MPEKGFFGIYGDTIKSKNPEDLKSKLSKIDSSVRKERTSEDRERYCIKYYLEKLTDGKILEFPIEIQKTESPDFSIINPKGKITGLEITEATNEDYQQALTETERLGNDAMIELSFFRSDRPLSKGSYKTAIRKKDQELIGEGWRGDSAKKDWTECLMAALRRKLEKLNGDKYLVLSKYELLIYDNCPSSICIKSNELIELIKDCIEKINNSYKKKFDAISILRGYEIIRYVGDKNFIMLL